MKKKLWMALVIIFIIVNIYNATFAISTTPNANYNLLMPKDNIVTSEHTTLLSGKAKMGSNINIYVYNCNHTFNINNLIKTPAFNTKLKVGELERFNIELELPLGRNEIIVEIKNGNDSYIFNKTVNVTNSYMAEKYIKNTHILKPITLE